VTHPRITQGAAALAAIALGAFLWSACSDNVSDFPMGPSAAALGQSPDIHAAIAAQGHHTDALLRIPGVVGTAVALVKGKAAVRIFVERADVRGLPGQLDGMPVDVKVTGRFMALSDPTTRQRPAPLGYSVGHPAITAGSIGGRVVDGAGAVYVLSNNHVLANSNDASIGDPALQPGPYDGGTAPADQIGTLAAFNTIDFSGGSNTIDAAIARSDATNLGNATPTDDGYGTPSAAIYGDANNDGVFDDKTTLLGLNVRSTGARPSSRTGRSPASTPRWTCATRCSSSSASSRPGSSISSSSSRGRSRAGATRGP